MIVRHLLSLSSVVVFLLFLLIGAPATFGQGAATAPGVQDVSPGSVRSHALGEQRNRLPKHYADGSDLPNGWRITPAGELIGSMGDLVTNMVASPDGRVVVAINSGFVRHYVDVFDASTHQRLQHIHLTATFLGMAWSADGHTLFVAGGNASGPESHGDPVAPIYAFSYDNGRLRERPVAKFVETIDPKKVFWSGVAYYPAKHWLYAANMGNDGQPSNIVVFDTDSHQIVTRITVGVSPYQVVSSGDGSRLFVSNWSSESVSVIDTATNKVIRTLHVGMNPNDMKRSADGRLFVACSNDNTVWVIDARTLQVIEHLSTTLTPQAPEGSTPDALAVDDRRKLLYIANADNNSIAVAHIADRSQSKIIGFIPTAWYPSALVLADRDQALYIANAKGEEGHPDPLGPFSPLLPAFIMSTNMWDGEGSVRSLQNSSIRVLPLEGLQKNLPGWTRQVVEDTPYKDSLLAEARPALEPSIIPQRVGETAPIKHIIYIIKENRTYDQVFGDLPNANGDPRLTLFGEKVTPNQHALAKAYVTLDNLYTDGEVSVDGHSWSTAAYATDFNEKSWPARYGQISVPYLIAHAAFPSAGHIWDLAKRKGLTYRDYGEFGRRVSTSTGTVMEPGPDSAALVGHFARDYVTDIVNVRETERVKVFLRDLQGYEENYDSPDPGKRLPNLTVMSMPGDHTLGTLGGSYTPEAMVADNDYAIGQLVDAVSHSRYWQQTAIFIIEDDAQDGADHVDARRTVGLVISPYVKRGVVDSTLYSTSSMLRSMELLLGLPPMSQYDAAAMPMYAAFGTAHDTTSFTAISPRIDTEAMNTEKSYGTKASGRMNFAEVDRAPMRELNEIIWKSVKGADSEMPTPVHRFRPLIDVSDSDDDDRQPAKKAKP
jgi:YVTN family beta-propeller protein